MAICSGCGGVVGRDCFNPQECEWIARDQERRYMMEQAQAAAAEAVADAIPPGVPMRDWFAGLAMQAMLTRGAPLDSDQMALDAYVYADAMLKAREDEDES